MDEKQFEQDYRNWKRQTTPDLWDRIDGKLRDYPERNSENISRADESSSAGNLPGKRRIYRIYRFAAGFAAVLCFAAAVPGLYQKLSVQNENGAGFQEAAPAAGLEESTAQAKDQEAAFAAKLEETTAPIKDQEAVPAAIPQETMAAEGEMVLGDNGVTLTSDRLTVPEDALTVSSDSAYFSQAILRDTELLCTGTVENASLEYDSQGRAVRVAYQLSLNQIHFAQDYFDQSDQITVKSPIVKAEGDEAWLLYQMEPEKTYLLPLKKQEGNWELIYPFAPQIQLTADGGHLFHSGYSSLMNESTQVVAGEKEGENDYFYDRMLLREDDGFLSDFLKLIQQQ